MKNNKKEPSFREKVLEIVRNIPKGSVMTYKTVAFLAGSPRACRTVGSIMSKNFDESIPCHRVIRSDGKLGEYNRGAELKGERLRMEGAIK